MLIPGVPCYLICLDDLPLIPPFSSIQLAQTTLLPPSIALFSCISVPAHPCFLAYVDPLFQTRSHNPIQLLEASLLPFHTLPRLLIPALRPIIWLSYLNALPRLRPNSQALDVLSTFRILLNLATSPETSPSPRQGGGHARNLLAAVLALEEL